MILISSYLDIYLILSYLIGSYRILSLSLSLSLSWSWSYLILFHHILSYHILSHLTLSCLTLSCLISSHLILSYLILSFYQSIYPSIHPSTYLTIRMAKSLYFTNLDATLNLTGISRFPFATFWQTKVFLWQRTFSELCLEYVSGWSADQRTPPNVPLRNKGLLRPY